MSPRWYSLPVANRQLSVGFLESARMRRGNGGGETRILLMASLWLTCVAGCRTPQEWSQLVRGHEQADRERDRLARELEQSREKAKSLEEQVETLQGFEPGRPLDIFAPTSLEFARMTGGRDMDGQPGDDGVTVYLRPKDADGDVVKAPGKISVQLLDNSDLENPRLIAICRFEDPEELRRNWHGKFWTNHYSLDCPFPESVVVPKSGKLVVTVSFVDYATGKELSASQEVTVATGGLEAQTVGAKP